MISSDIIKKVFEEIIPFNTYLGIKVVLVEENYARLVIPFRNELIGDIRRPALHGGVISALLDSAGGAAAMTTLMQPEDRLSTIDIRVDYLLPGDPRDLVAEGKVIRRGNRIVVTEMVAFHENPHKRVADGKAVYNVRSLENGNSGGLDSR
ncbi:MAG: thioesterase family protein [Calditrichaeota bacterium]|nr:MAG: thioesterase family protein [Calditrichota bacterium]